VAALLLVALVTTSLRAQTAGLTAGPQLARVYDAIFDAHFEQVPALLAQTCGASQSVASALARTAKATAPPEACELLAAVSVLWQIQLDPKSRAHDETFRTRVDAVIADIEDWTQREPDRAEAWFYLGGPTGLARSGGS
jgi:hypothetical protein